MAQQGKILNKDKLSCSICLDLMKDPVTIPCGHSYCQQCIQNFWDEEDQKEVHSCPQCRQTFSPRPVLVRNIVLADLVDEKKKSGSQTEDQTSSDPGYMTCDVCTDRKLKAVKSCLQCLVSYCEQHLQPHYQSTAFEQHKLIDPSRKLQESICARHNEVMKVFCRTDQKCICYLCSIDDHRGHHTVSAAVEMNEKQKELAASQEKILQRIQEKVKDVKMLQEHVEAINQSADEAVKDTEKIFSDVKQQIRSRQKAEVTSVTELEEKLEQEISDLRRRSTELEKLSQTEDQVQFLLSYSSLSHPREATELTNICLHPLRFSEDAAATVSAFRHKLQDVLSEERIKGSPRQVGVEVLLPETEPKTREEFLKYACRLTLDSKTKHSKIKLKTALRAEYEDKLEYRCHPDRFTDWKQVLCKESLSGRCYWEVTWEPFFSDDGGYIAVAYKSISRTGAESVFGNNKKSWMLYCYDTGYEFRHNSIRTPFSGPRSSNIGVYLDHSAGTLSFYSITGSTMTLLHRVQTTFTQPVCPGLGLYDHRPVEFRNILNTSK